MDGADRCNQHDDMVDGLVHCHTPREQRRILKLVLDPVGGQVEVERRLGQLQHVVAGSPLEEPITGHFGANVVDEAARTVRDLDVLKGGLGATWKNGIMTFC